MADHHSAAQIDRRFLDGSASEPAEPMALRAGPLTLSFDSCGVRYVRLSQRELVRRIYFAVRDANWGTVPDTIENVEVDVRPQSFRIEFDVKNQQGEIDFTWHGAITGSAEGRIVFEASGVANSSFRRNRIGFCVLHPLECAGLPVEIRHEDGTAQRTEFPRHIAAANPFLNVVGMRHEAAPGVDVELTFEGDVFETEDQRNWIDASYKTFCTPLTRPFPVEVAAGQQIKQRITMELKGAADREQGSGVRSQSSGAGSVRLDLGSVIVGKLPGLGFGMPADGGSPSRQEVERLRLLKPAHLRCEMRVERDIPTQLGPALELVSALACGTELELVVFAGSHHENGIGQLAEHVRVLKLPIARWIVFPATGWSTTREVAQAASRAIRKQIPDAIIGGGTPANFRELNAAPPPADELDFVTWSLNPQVHATDNASLVETLAAHDATVESARQLCENLPVVVGPIAFKMQVNPYATGPWPPKLPAGQLPPQVDVRQLSLLGAGWTIGSIKHLAESRVQAATYYETVGWKGLMERDSGSPLPDKFPSHPGGVFPQYHVFADLAEFAGGDVVPIRSSGPLRVDALAVTSGTRMCLFVANFTNRSQTATLPVVTSSAKARFLDERNVVAAMSSPETFRGDSGEEMNATAGQLTVNLLPFAVARIDLE